MKNTLTIATLKSKIRRKAIKMIAKYYIMEYKLKTIEGLQYAILTRSADSILEDDDMILESIKDQHRVLKGEK